MKNLKDVKYLIKEIPSELADLSSFFEDDGLSEASGDFNNTIFILKQTRYGYQGFNDDVYNELVNELEIMIDDYQYIGDDFGNYETLDDFLADYDEKYIDYLDFITSRSIDYTDPEYMTSFLNLKTGGDWRISPVTGYSQGDYVEVVYCENHYIHPEIYGETWLGMAREFSVTDLENDDTVWFIIADSQVTTDLDYKTLVSEWYGIDEAEAELQLIDDYYTYTEYKYKTL